MPEAILSIENVHKSYSSQAVLRGVNLELAAGERVALVGPSGEGKSTLLNCAGGIDRPDEGRIHLAGERLDQLSEAGLCRIRQEVVSTIFQFFHLLPTLTARENVEFPLRLIGDTEVDIRAKTETLFEEVELDHRIDAFPHEMSGGEMQRVAIARALSIRPRLILADEPTGNLDSTTGQAILTLIEEVSERHQIAMLLVTHSEKATEICHRVLKMQDGVLLESSGISQQTLAKS